MTVSALGGYWVLPWMMASGVGIQNPSNLRIVSVLMTYTIGLVTMMVSDAQKYYTLKYKKGLIADGMFKITRNPNYLGEVMIYLSFAMTVGNYIAYAIPMSVWLSIFVVFMNCKELSLKKKVGWAEYSKTSYMFLPRIFSNHILNLVLYAGAAFSAWNLYSGKWKVF